MKIKVVCLLFFITLGTNLNVVKSQDNGGAEDVESLQSCLDRFADILAKYEKFDVFRKAYYEGEYFFSKPDEELRKQFAGIYKEISKAVKEDRLNESEGRKLKAELRDIGKNSRKLTKENGKELGEEDSLVIKTDLDELNEKLKEAAFEKIPLQIYTPILNDAQMCMEELLDYSALSGELSSGRVKRYAVGALDLEKKEDQTKSDKVLNDTERKRILQRCVVIFDKFLIEFER